MRTFTTMTIVAVFLASIFSIPALAGEAEYEDPDGIRVKFDENGQIISFISDADSTKQSSSLV